MERIFDIIIKGISPLLMSKFSDNTDESSLVKTEYSDDVEFNKRLYFFKETDGKIVIAQPAEHIERAMQKAAVNFKYKGKKTYMDYFKSGVFVEPDLIPHVIQHAVPDKRAVTIVKSKIMRVRPRLDQWKLSFQIKVINPDISEKALNEILVYAGNFIGIGDYRPRYGRFLIEKFELMS